MTKEERKQTFLQKASKIHKNKYNYSKVDYINANTKVCIICPEHGEFWQTPHHHLEGHGCKKCADEKLQALKADTKEIFIEKAIKVHNNKYNYDLVQYINQRTPVTIICPKHGKFEQTSVSHLNGAGCPKCAIEKVSQARKLTLEQFLSRSNQIHGNKYDYSKVKFNSVYDYITIICPIHGSFKQRVCNHLNGRGCSKCKQSKGEELIQQILTEQNIEFIPQYKIPIDKAINTSGFTQVDFYLPNYNIIIEYNGIQHYIPQKYFGGKLRYDTYQIPRDNYIKNYCKQNSIRLVEIDYTHRTKQDIINYIKDNVKEIFTR